MKKKPALNPVHPLVLWVLEELQTQGGSFEKLAQKSGISTSAMRKWRTGHRTPTLSALEPIINALGYELHIRKRSDDNGDQ